MTTAIQSSAGAGPETSAGQSRGILFVLAAALLWSTAGIGIKYLPLDPFRIASLRALIAALILLPLLRPRALRFRLDHLGLLLSYALMSGCFVAANKWTTAANAIAIQYTAPIWIFIALVLAARVKLSLRRSAPMLMIAAGIILFLMEPETGSSVRGNLIAVASGAGFALVTVFFGRLKDQPGPSLVCLANFATALFLWPLAEAPLSLPRISAGGWACLIYLGAIQIALAYVCYATGLKWVTPLKASTVALIEPILNPLWVFLLMKEIPSVYGFAGAAAILAGVSLDLALKNSNGQPSPDAMKPPAANAIIDPP